LGQTTIKEVDKMTAFLKRGVPSDLEVIEICPKCLNPKEKCTCDTKEKKGKKDGVHKESNNNRKLLHRQSN
jgi:hypothetical protein